MIPLDPIGYSVNQSTGTIHTRYADHGNGTKTRTQAGATTLLEGKQGKACQLCYPNPVYPKPEKPKVPQVRRSG